MPDFEIIFVHLLPTLGFVLAFVVLARILTERRSPASTMAWILAIAFVPYVGVPLYLMLGGRKMEHMVHEKPLLPNETPETGPVAEGEEGVDLPVVSGADSPPLMPARFHGVFPLTDDNHVVLLTAGEQAFDEAIRLIDGAEKSVDIATFILGKDETGRAIVEALAKKARQGLSVRLLLDAIGCVKIRKRFLRPLLNAGGKVAYFMPMMHVPFRGRANLRIHRKMLIVDGRQAIVGGMNYASEYMGPYRPEDRWLDLSMLVDGPSVAYLYEIFRSDWGFAARQVLPPVPPMPAVHKEIRPVCLQFIASGPDVKTDTLREAIITALFRATERVWIVTPYFVPDQTLSEALCMAAHRGVDVRIILPRKSNHRLADLARETYLRQLDEAGGSAMYYTPGMLHAKSMIVDNTVGLVGSANMDMRSLLLNYEVGLCIYNESVVRELDAWMGWLQTHCDKREPVHSDRLSVMNGVGRLLAPLL